MATCNNLFIAYDQSPHKKKNVMTKGGIGVKYESKIMNIWNILKWKRKLSNVVCKSS